MAHPFPFLTCNFNTIDLNSSVVNLVPEFTFRRGEQPITLLRTRDVGGMCLYVKGWLLQVFGMPSFSAPGIVRMDSQELHTLDTYKVSHGEDAPASTHSTEGWVLLAEDICFSKKGGHKVVLLAALVPGDQRVRWFYSLLPIVTLLKILDSHSLLEVAKQFQPGTQRYARFKAYMRESFLAAVTIPHSPDFLNAETITDYCPDILNPDTALRRLERNETLYFAHKNPLDAGLDISEDRYLLYLHEAEREVASIAQLKCAEYMLVKRNFFKGFFEDVYRSDKRLDGNGNSSSTRRGGGAATAPAGTERAERAETATPSSRPQTPASTPTQQRAQSQTPARGVRRTRVRTDAAHRTWLENVYQMPHTRAKLMVVAWKELGFLEEGWFLDWVEAGGMLEEIGRGGVEGE